MSGTRNVRRQVPIDVNSLTEDEHRALAKELHHRWLTGEKKSPLEREYFGKAGSHGKYFTSYVKEWTGHDTERPSSQTDRIRELEAIVRAGKFPLATDEQQGEVSDEVSALVENCRESALAALRIYNDPTASFRTESFAILMRCSELSPPGDARPRRRGLHRT